MARMVFGMHGANGSGEIFGGFGSAGWQPIGPGFYTLGGFDFGTKVRYRTPTGATGEITGLPSIPNGWNNAAATATYITAARVALEALFSIVVDSEIITGFSYGGGGAQALAGIGFTDGGRVKAIICDDPVDTGYNRPAGYTVPVEFWYMNPGPLPGTPQVAQRWGSVARINPYGLNTINHRPMTRVEGLYSPDYGGYQCAPQMTLDGAQVPAGNGFPGEFVPSLWSTTTTPPPATGGGAPPTYIGGEQIFPATFVYYADVSALPVRSDSSARINGSLNYHGGYGNQVYPDFGDRANGRPWGIPYYVVPSTQPLVNVTIDYVPAESNPGPAPIPPYAEFEHIFGDDHVIIIVQGQHVAWEFWSTRKVDNNNYIAGAVAKWDLLSNAGRTPGWTSAEGSGMPMIPSLLLYDEVNEDRINHAIRMTMFGLSYENEWPASHSMGGLGVRGDLMKAGTWLRLKSSFNTAGLPPFARRIAEAMKKHGCIVIDFGTNFKIEAAPDSRWPRDADLAQLSQVPGSAFEVIDTSSLRASTTDLARWYEITQNTDGGTPPPSTNAPTDAWPLYHAENATLLSPASPGIAKVLSTSSGAHGSGYVGSWYQSPEGIRFSVTAPAAGDYDIKVRYRQAFEGGTPTRVLRRNGTNVAYGTQAAGTPIAFPPNASAWDASTWTELTIPKVALTSGAQTIDLMYSAGGGPDVDEITFAATVTGGGTGGTPTTTFDVKTNRTGFRSAGYVGGWDAVGETIRWTGVNFPTSAAYRLKFRYALKGTASASRNVYIDDVLVGTLLLTPTTTSDTADAWAEKVLDVASVAAGLHRVDVRIDTGQGGVLVDWDWMEVWYPPSTGGGTTTPPTTTPPPPPTTGTEIVVQAEAGTLLNAVPINGMYKAVPGTTDGDTRGVDPGYRGTGYVGSWYQAGEGLSLPITPAQAGAHTLRLRYRNAYPPGSPAAQRNVTLNGVALPQLSFPVNAAAWTDPSFGDITRAGIVLNAGVNTLLLVIPGVSGVQTRPEGATFNVKTGYGAVGNGVANDTTAIQNALNAAAAAGTATAASVVLVPAGTYLITAALNISSNVILRGEGSGVSIIKNARSRTDTTFTTMLQPLSGAMRSNMIVEKVQFHQEGQYFDGGLGYDSSNALCVSANWTTNMVIQDCRFEDNRTMCVWTDSAGTAQPTNGLKILRNYVARTNGDAFSFFGQLFDCIVQDNEIHNTADEAIAFQATSTTAYPSRILCRGNTIADCTRRAHLVGGEFATPNGINVHGADQVIVENNTITTVFGSCIRSGFGARKATNVIIRGNYCSGAGAAGGTSVVPAYGIWLIGNDVINGYNHSFGTNGAGNIGAYGLTGFEDTNAAGFPPVYTATPPATPTSTAPAPITGSAAASTQGIDLDEVGITLETGGSTGGGGTGGNTGGTTTPTQVAVVVQAETGSWANGSGKVEDTPGTRDYPAGFNGTAVVGGAWGPGDTVTIPVTIPAGGAGDYALRVRYVNPETFAFSRNLTVNGVSRGTIGPFPPSPGGYSAAYQNLTKTALQGVPDKIPLVVGVNNLVFTTTGEYGNLLLDEIEVTGTISTAPATGTVVVTTPFTGTDGAAWPSPWAQIDTVSGGSGSGTSSQTFDFAGTNGAALPSPWVTRVQSTGAAATIQTNRARLSTGSIGAYEDRMVTTFPPTAQDYTLTADFVVVQTSGEQFMRLLFRHESGGNVAAGYALEIGLDAGGGFYYWLYRRDASFGAVTLDAGAALTGVVVGDVFHLKVTVAGSALSYKIWKNAAAEPGTATGSVTDATFATGQIGLELAGGNAAGVRTWDVDNVVATFATGGGGGTTESVGRTNPGVLWLGAPEPTQAQANAFAPNAKAIVITPWFVDTKTRVRAANPAIKVLAYHDMYVTVNDGFQSNGTTDWSLPFSGGMGYAWALQNHPDWFSLNGSGQRYSFTDYAGRYVMKVGLAAYQNQFAANIIAEAQQYGYDGVFLDDALSIIAHGINVSTDYDTNAKVKAATASFLTNVGGQLRAAGIACIPNVAGIANVGGLWAEWDQLGTGLFEEKLMFWDNVAANWQGASLTKYMAEGIPNPDHSPTNQWRAFNWVNSYGDASSIDTLVNPVHALYLCYTDGSSVLSISPDIDAYGGTAGAGYVSPEMLWNLGPETVARAEITTYCFIRKFQNGVAVVRIDDGGGTVSVPLGGTYYDRAGTAFTTLSMGNKSGKILKSNSGTSAPPAPTGVAAATATIVSNRGRIALPAVGAYASKHEMGFTPSTQDYELVGDFVFPAVTERRAGVRFRRGGSGVTTAWYSLVAQVGYASGNGVLLERKDASGTVTTLASAAQAIVANDVVHWRVQIIGSAIKARYWLNAAAEPSTWNFQVTDATLTSGLVSLFATGGDAATAVNMDFDNFTLSTTSGGSTGGGGTTPPPPPVTVGGARVIGGIQLFPADFAGYADVSAQPVALDSAARIAGQAAQPEYRPEWGTAWYTNQLDADFGSGLVNGRPFGYPMRVVPSTQPLVPISGWTESWSQAESDAGPIPVPLDMPVEHNFDRHWTVLQEPYWLHEAWLATAGSGGWVLGQYSRWDMRTNAMRPANITSAVASGMPALPQLVTYDEVAAGDVKHALFMCIVYCSAEYVWPANHVADTSSGVVGDLLRMGDWLRLKSTFDVNAWNLGPQAKQLCVALKAHGAIVNDIGPNWKINGVADNRWSNADLATLHNIPNIHNWLELVNVGSLIESTRSMSTTQA